MAAIVGLDLWGWLLKNSLAPTWLSTRNDMPRYFIDTHDSERHLHDEDGSSLPDLRTACDEAVRLLPNIARDLLSGGDPIPNRGWRDFVSTVKDESSQLLFRATLSLSTEWLASDLPPEQTQPGQAQPGPTHES